MITIRHATPDDVGQLVAMGETFLRWSAFGRQVPFDGVAMGQAIDALLASGVVLVADLDGDVVGALLGTLSPLWFAPGTKVAAELAWWVDESERGGRAGVKLLRAFEQWGAEQGATLCVLSDLVIAGQTPAANLFEKLGYAVVERSHLKELV